MWAVNSSLPKGLPMASEKYEKKYGHLPDVVAGPFRKGCELCGKKGRHTHTQPDWREAVDRAGRRMGWS